MTFTVTYREKSGAKSEVVIEALNRAECMAACKARGIVPVGVREGRNAAKVSGKYCSGVSKRCMILSASVVLAAVLVGVGVWLTRKDAPATSAPMKTKTVTRSDAQATKPRETPAAVPAVTKVQEAPSSPVATKEPPPISPTNIVTILSVVTNAYGSVTERYIRADGKKVRSMKPATQIFKHVSDDVLAMIATTPPSQDMPPLPFGAITDEQFLQSLNDPILVNDDDSEQTKLLKQSVIALRQAVKALMDRGQTVQQILAEHQKLHQENVGIRTQALLEVRKLLDAGDRKEAIHYATMINVALQQMGIDSLPVPAEDPAEEPTRRARPKNGERK